LVVEPVDDDVFAEAVDAVLLAPTGTCTALRNDDEEEMSGIVVKRSSDAVVDAGGGKVSSYGRYLRGRRYVA
jgi:hypothetical protein